MKIQKEIAFKDNTITEEELPLRYVYYPGFYGAFFGFSESLTSEIHICDCSRPAIENYFNYRKQLDNNNSQPEKNYILSSNEFPFKFVQNMMKQNIKKDDIIRNINFSKNICHQCNKTIPKLRYCNEMYGGLFKQTFGWYIRRKYYEIGIEPFHNIPIVMEIPDEIFDLININPKEYFSLRLKYLEQGFEKVTEFDKKWQKQKRKITKIVENEVRAHFGYKEIGSAWIGETTLYNIILRNFSKYKIIRHYRPKFLDYLELDIYIPTLKFGIEYQGQQHYIPIKHWGGEEALKKTKERDKKKEILCKKNNIKVLYIRFDEPLSEDYIMDKIARLLNKDV